MSFRYILLATTDKQSGWPHWSIHLSKRTEPKGPKLELINHASNHKVRIDDWLSLVRGIVLNASHFEWKQKLGEQFEARFADLISKDSKAKDVFDLLVSNGPEEIFASKDIGNIFTNCNKLDLHDTFIDREIFELARKVANTKTIFLIPNYLTESEIELNSDFIRFLSIGILNKSNLLKGNIDIGLAPLHLISKSPSKNSLFNKLMLSLSDQISQINHSEFNSVHLKRGPLLIEGATGTGKSQAAKLLAERKKSKIFSVNLASISGTESFEARMKGVDDKIYTDVKAREGWFELAQGGILFLDEFQSVDLSSQTYLLDVLNATSDEVTVGRIGSELKPETYSVKVILAVNEPIKDLLNKGKLREDLFHRIRDIITFKSLNELMNDKNYNFEFFKYFWIFRWKSFDSISIENVATTNWYQLFPDISDDAIDLISQSNWPGSFRQFERFFFDIFWNISLLATASIEYLIIKDALLRENVRSYRENDDQPIKEASEDIYDEIASLIENTIYENNFRMVESAEAIGRKGKIYGISSRKTLYKFIINNKDRFSDNFLRDPKLIRVLERYSRKYQ